MKLGTETGSLTNHILSRMVVGQPEPQVGMGATLLGWTDRHAATITQVWTHRGGLYIAVREDKATRTDQNGMSESQSYDYEFDPRGTQHLFRRGRSGAREEVHFNTKTKRYNKSGGYGLRIGERESHRDFSS